MAKAVRMADIAEKLGISIVTVSKALSGKDGVGSELRESIIKLAKEMGYSGKITSDISLDRKYTIGIINLHIYLKQGSSFYWTLYERLLKHLSDNGDFGILEVINEDDIVNLNCPRLIKEKRVDGVIIMGPFPDEYYRMLQTLDFPMVSLDSYNPDFNFSSVISDGFYGMYTMTHHLIAEGHRKIAYVGTVGETSSITDRYFGYCRAMLETGTRVTDDMVIPDRNDIGKILINLPDDIDKKFTALACNCDYTAYEVLKILNEKDIKVPDDISIVGFDNYILSEISNIGITTYEVDTDRMAEASVRQIKERIGFPDSDKHNDIISGKILYRESVKKIRNRE